MSAAEHPGIKEMMDAAADDMAALTTAQDSATARAAWIAFLEHTGRALNRLEAYAKQSGQRGKYNRLKSKDVWADKIAAYVVTARNSHEHGLEPVQMSEPFNTRMVFPGGRVVGAPVILVETKDGRRIASVADGPAEVTVSGGVRAINLPAGVRLIPVKSGRSGLWVEPPHVAIETEAESEPSAMARAYHQWLTDQIRTYT